MAQMMVRTAKNDFDAFAIADAMTRADADVVSIVMKNSNTWNVYARIRDDEHMLRVDAEILTRVYKYGAEAES